MRIRWVARIVTIVLLVSGCTVPTSGNPATSPPITESETRQIVGQPFDVTGLDTSVSPDGLLTITVTGEVPSACHTARMGIEEPNAAGVLVGEVESWLDPRCEVTGEPIDATTQIDIEGLDDGFHTVEISDLSTDFVIGSERLVQGEWVLRSMTVDGTEHRPSDAYVTLLVEDGSLSGSSGCNGYNGTVERSFVPGSLWTSAMACVEVGGQATEGNELEAVYSPAFFRISRYDITRERLTLTGDGVTMSFERDQ